MIKSIDLYKTELYIDALNDLGVHRFLRRVEKNCGKSLHHYDPEQGCIVAEFHEATSYRLGKETRECVTDKDKHNLQVIVVGNTIRISLKLNMANIETPKITKPKDNSFIL